MPKYKVHPDAAIFPMMSEVELQEMAASIKEHGLFHPIMLGKWTETDKNGKEKEVEGLIDGRNRDKGCEIAGVEPTYQQFTGTNIKAYIAAANLSRRDLTRSQKAMAMAMIYPDAENTHTGKKSTFRGEKYSDVSAAAISIARKVFRENKALAKEVISGITSIDAAGAKVDSTLEQNKKDNKTIEWLKTNFPNLHEEFQKDRITLEKAKERAENQIKEEKAAEQARIDGLRKEYQETFDDLKEKLEAINSLEEGKYFSIPKWFSENPHDPEIVYKDFQKFFPRGSESFLAMSNCFEAVAKAISTVYQTVVGYERSLKKDQPAATVSRIGPRPVDLGEK